jgi:hypothetical protein
VAADLYRDILFAPGRSEADGAVTIGGMFGQPDLARSYLLAARMTIDIAVSGNRLPDVALPVAYLQRHALELAIKDLLTAAYEIAADDAWVTALAKDHSAERTTPEAVPTRHDLFFLLNRLRSALDAIGHGPVPPAIEQLVTRLHAKERVMTDEEAAAQSHARRQRVSAHDPSRLRYERLTSGAPSFPDSTRFDIAETQRLLEDAFAHHLLYQPDEYDNSNLTTGLVHSDRALLERLVSLVGIERL